MSDRIKGTILFILVTLCPGFSCMPSMEVTRCDCDLNLKLQVYQNCLFYKENNLFSPTEDRCHEISKDVACVCQVYRRDKECPDHDRYY